MLDEYTLPGSGVLAMDYHSVILVIKNPICIGTDSFKYFPLG